MIPFSLIWFSCRESSGMHVFVCASSARSRGGPRHLVTTQAALPCALGKSHRERVVGVEQGRNRTRGYGWITPGGASELALPAVG